MKKVTAAELRKVSDNIIATSTTLAIVSVVPDIMAFEKQHGNFSEVQREMLNQVFRDIATAAVGLHSQLISEMMIKYEGVELDMSDEPTEDITSDPEKFEQLLRQFGGIKGTA